MLRLDIRDMAAFYHVGVYFEAELLKLAELEPGGSLQLLFLFQYLFLRIVVHAVLSRELHLVSREEVIAPAVHDLAYEALRGFQRRLELQLADFVYHLAIALLHQRDRNLLFICAKALEALVELVLVLGAVEKALEWVKL